jgi:hypothetical protein
VPGARCAALRRRGAAACQLALLRLTLAARALLQLDLMAKVIEALQGVS